MYKKILVPYDKSDPAKNALGAALDLAAGVPGAQITVLSVVDWHDFNAETFKIASRMSGVMGDTMDMDVISEVENEAIKADMDACREHRAFGGRRRGHRYCRGERLAARFHHGLCRRGRLRLHRHGPSRSGCRAWDARQRVLLRAAQDQRARAHCEIGSRPWDDQAEAAASREAAASAEALEVAAADSVAGFPAARDRAVARLATAALVSAAGTMAVATTAEASGAAASGAVSSVA